MSGVLESGEPIGGAELWAEPAAAIEQATVQERIERMAARGRTTEQGFFQLVGLEPGGYRLMARSQDRERQQVGEVEIRAGSETHLEHAITLHRALRYFVEVVPPVAPDGGAWSIELRSESDALSFGVPRVVAASEEGLALFERLIPGTYTLSVSDSSGARLAEQTDRVEAVTRTVIEVPLIEVRGHLKLDGEPLVGDVSVATGSSDEVTLITDGEDAELAGWIRQPKLAWLLITVRAQDPLIERRLRLPMPPIRARRMKLDIELDGTDLEGVVVDAFDQPVAGASVRANAPGLGWAKGRSDDSGHFALRALSPGPYELSARHRKPSLGESEQRTVELFEGHAPPFQRLVLTRRVELRGRVVNADTASVAGASVDVMTVGPIPSHDREVTGLDGAFRMHVAAGAVAARFTIRAPSQLLWSTCLPLEEPLRDVMLQLPSVGVGTLEVIWPVPVAPSAWSPILVSDDGGVFDVQVLHDWNGALGGRGLVGDDVAHTVSVTVPRMAAGRRYALLELAQGTMPIGPGCRLNPPRAPDWVFLPVGSSVVVAAQENKEGQN